MSALLSLSVPILSSTDTQRSDASALRQQFSGLCSSPHSKLMGVTSTQAKTPSRRSTHITNALGLRRYGAPEPSALSLLAPLTSRYMTLETYEPRLRLVEDETTYKLIASVPGVSADSITLSVTDDGLLKLDAKIKSDGRELLQRTVRLAEDADLTAVKAVCADGILEVTVSKMQPPAPISIAVEASEPLATDDLYVIQKRLPGLSADEVKVSLEASRVGRSAQTYQLAIRATSAKGYGEYHFTQTLPEDIIPEGATAYCCHGLLHIRVPRVEPTRVSVPVASCADETAQDEEQLQLAQFKAPGYSAEQVFLWAMPGCLRVKFQRTPKEVAERLVVLPDEVDLHSIRAACVDGVLTVQVPKSTLRKTETREIVVSSERSS
jgi:HSP20 family molecular chaperone IbpA